MDSVHCVSAFVHASRRAFLAGRMLRLLRLIAPRVYECLCIQLCSSLQFTVQLRAHSLSYTARIHSLMLPFYCIYCIVHSTLYFAFGYARSTSSSTCCTPVASDRSRCRSCDLRSAWRCSMRWSSNALFSIAPCWTTWTRLRACGIHNTCGAKFSTILHQFVHINSLSIIYETTTCIISYEYTLGILYFYLSLNFTTGNLYFCTGCEFYFIYIILKLILAFKRKRDWHARNKNFQNRPANLPLTISRHIGVIKLMECWFTWL